jgi:putative spermidine/putrescine transport system ATP-binding protein
MTVATETRAQTQGVEVRLEQLVRTYGTLNALDGLDLTLAPGELVALLGPSGCGKTTALRILAGLDDATSGRVFVAGRDLSNVPANKRDMGMVFQAYSLFPHMTTRQNVEFGLKLRGVKADQRRSRAMHMLELVGLETHSEKYAHQLSGGQQQRVALARALAFEPSVLLLDEPLSALDAKVRAQLRDEIRRVQVEVGTTTLFVTHDQEEALAIADRVGVMRAGRLEQIADPETMYTAPAKRFVAEFVGLTNRLAATVTGGNAVVFGTELPLLDGSIAEGRGTALIRPESVNVGADPGGNAVIVTSSFLGPISRLRLKTDDGLDLVAQLPRTRGRGPGHGPAGARAGPGGLRLKRCHAPVLVVSD